MLALRVRGPFRLPAVVVSHGWFQTAPFAWDEAGEALERVERLPGGVARLRVTAAPGGVRVAADRPLEGADAAGAVSAVRRMLQLERDLSGLADAAREVDPALGRAVEARGAGRLLAGSHLFEDVVKGVCGTNVTWRQAVAAIGRVAALGEDGAFPPPAAVLRAGEGRLRAEARVGYRAPFLLEAARAAIDGRLGEIERASEEGDGARVAALLQALPGVGPATAGFLCLLLGHYDRPMVDSATLRVAAAAWFEGRRPRPGEVLRRVAPAGPFAGLVLYLATMAGWQRETGLGPA